MDQMPKRSKNKKQQKNSPASESSQTFRTLSHRPQHYAAPYAVNDGFNYAGASFVPPNSNPSAYFTTLRQPDYFEPGHVPTPRQPGYFEPGYAPTPRQPGYFEPGHAPTPRQPGYFEPGHVPTPRQPGYFEPGHVPTPRQPGYFEPGHMPTPRQPDYFEFGHVPAPRQPSFEPSHKYDSPADPKLKAYIHSLEQRLKKMGNDFQKLSHTVGETQTKSPMTSKSTLKTCIFSSSVRKEPSKISEFPVKSQNPCKNPSSNKKQSSKSIEKILKSKNSSEKLPVATATPKAKNIDGKNKEKSGSNVTLKEEKNSIKKGQQSKPSTKEPCKDTQSKIQNTVDKNNHHKSTDKLVKKMTSKSNPEKKDQRSKVWNLYVTINADIDITLHLSNVLIERIKNKIQFEIKSVTKDKTTGYVKFLLGFHSKHQMTTAMKLFNHSNKGNAIKIDCNRVADDENQDKPNILQNKQKCQKDVVQEQHEKKIEKVREEITSLMCSMGGTFSSQEANSSRVKTLEYKERELILQLVEYKNTRKDLEIQLKKLEEAGKEDSVEKELFLKNLDQEKKFLSKALPIYAMRSKISKTVLNNNVTILMGNCGSGKSTQLIQYLMETSLVDQGPIVCTEPSEKQALSLAKYVATEVNSSLGNLVGFSSENNIHLSIHTNALFMSDQELLNQFQKMNSFSVYSCIIIDEAQERTIYTDLLLSLLRQELTTVSRLRIIIITAPADISIYQSFFTDYALVEVNSCLFPVQVFWGDKTQSLKTSAIEKALEVHHTEDEGDILVFMASIHEVIECCTYFKMYIKMDNYMCFPLHSELNYEQLKGIYKVYRGKRKIIFTTDCAEVMNAIPNVKYVIDTGLKKERFLESGNKNDLPISLISQESSKHRKEKAGSYFAGKCYRLYSQKDFKTMMLTKPDEMYLDGSVEKVVMLLIKQGIDPMKFKFITNVFEDRISHALRNLENLGAILNDNGKYEMTDLGTRMSMLPFRLHINWMLLEGIKQEMKMESVALASLSDLKIEVFCTETEDDKIMQKHHLVFGQPCGSLAIRTLKVLRAWFKQPDKEKKSWCKEHFLNERSIKSITSYMKDICKNLTTKLEVNVKFNENLPINNIKVLEELIDKSLNLTSY